MSYTDSLAWELSLYADRQMADDSEWCYSAEGLAFLSWAKTENERLQKIIDSKETI